MEIALNTRYRTNRVSSSSRAVWTVDNNYFMLAFLLAFTVVYGFPKLGFPMTISQVIFLVWLLVIYLSKKDYFWLSWFFILNDSPGRLFGSTSGAEIYRLPLYNIIPGVSLSFQELFLFMYLLKYLTKTNKPHFVFKRHFSGLLIYGIIMLAYSFFIGISGANLITSIRSILPWFWILIIPAFIKDEDELIASFRLLAPFIIISLALQMHAQVSGLYLHHHISGVEHSRYISGAEERLIRVYHGVFVMYYCMIQSLRYHLANKLNGNYLLFILFAGLFSLYLSATRGWVIASLILLSSVFVSRGYAKFVLLLRIVVIAALSVYLLMSLFPYLEVQTEGAYNRLMTMESFAKGDLTAEGTLSRVTDRGPRVMRMFRESPFIGWGFSDVYHRWADGHVGNQTMLLNGGIVGYLIWLSIYLIIIAKAFKGTNNVNRYVYVFTLISVFAIHSSSTQILGFSRSGFGAFGLLGFLLTSISNSIKYDGIVYRPRVRLPSKGDV